ncbi:zinc-binding dehydrogenase, partial [Actinacidiphila oryziradicis]|uniref:zinc-binding dehydrogenase n=1 Tax=Actinacidiphila oryziradicis TaxID=2571141 RepID=UPI0023F2BBBB
MNVAPAENHVHAGQAASSSSDIREAVLELTGGRGADMALDTVGGALFEPALRSLRFDGRMIDFQRPRT